MPSSSSKEPESSLWYRFRRSRRRLRIGLLASAPGVDAWLADLIESLARLPEFEIGDLFLLPARRSSVEADPPGFFLKLEAWSRAGASPRFEVSNDLPSSIQRHELSGGSGAELPPEDRELIAARRLDVLLCAASPGPAGDCSNLARLGVWSFLLGAPEFAGYRPPYWREVYEGRSVSEAWLLVHNNSFDRGRAIGSFATGTDQSLRFTMNQAAPLEAAGAVLGQNLLLAAERDAAPSGGEEIELSTVSRRWPSTVETLTFACRKLARSAALRAGAGGRSQRWFTGIRPARGAVDLPNAAGGEPFAAVVAPPGHFYADPFLVERDSRHWLFVEDADSSQKGRLSCMEIASNGTPGEPVVILDKPYHLSYPHLFSHYGEFFMIPETAENATVQLYRARRFPFEWEFEALLMEGAPLVDTTAFHYDGKWYFFTSTAAQPEELYLFTADRLDGRWDYHPANPIAMDTRSLRGAGAIFWHGNTLIRPAQDCSLSYGCGLTFNEIRRLSPSEYEERQAGRLMPTWERGLTGVHTFNRDSKYEAMDWKKLVRVQSPETS